MDLDKIRATIEWPTPPNLTQLKGFFGLCGFYRRFVKGFSQTIAPCTDLTRKGALVWTKIAQSCFEHFK